MVHVRICFSTRSNYCGISLFFSLDIWSFHLHYLIWMLMHNWWLHWLENNFVYWQYITVVNKNSQTSRHIFDKNDILNHSAFSIWYFTQLFHALLTKFACHFSSLKQTRSFRECNMTVFLFLFFLLWSKICNNMLCYILCVQYSVLKVKCWKKARNIVNLHWKKVDSVQPPTIVC